MKANELLASAGDTISVRNATHGDSKDNMRRTAMLLSAYLEIPIHDYQVAVIMQLVKISRTQESPYLLDHWLDLLGYGAIAGELALGEELD
jgi:Domain of unknown function (DUF6378)